MRLTDAGAIVDLAVVMIAMVTGGLVAAWVGAGILQRLPTRSLVVVIGVLLFLVSALFLAESMGTGTTVFRLSDPSTRVIAAGLLGLMIVRLVACLEWPAASSSSRS